MLRPASLYFPRILLFLLLPLGILPCLGAERPNVLMIAIDDLRPELGCYGATHIKSPNIDALASGGLLFERCYCQQALCNPSRTSLMTGLRPETTGVVGNHTHFRDHVPDVVTLSEHFKNNGYHAQSIGKIYHGLFHDGTSKTKWDTMGDPKSWSVPTTRFSPRYYYTEDGIAQAKEAYQRMYRPANPGEKDWTTKLVFGPMTEAPDVPDNRLYDGKVADAAIATLAQLKKNRKKPFFLAIGFIKPHTPFVAPKRYWDLYEEDKIALATNPSFPKDAPALAGHNSGEVRRYTDQPKSGAFSKKNQLRLRHGYYACISYIDAQIGRVLNELKQMKLEDNTIVLLFGDHGWHLGEQNLWGKTTNFELDTRAPLIIRVPKQIIEAQGLGTKSIGQKTRALVEFLDIYPSLADLAGLPIAAELEGKSFVPLLKDPNQPWKPAAFSQYPRGKTMGYSMRTDRYRFTEWVNKSTGKVVARELYDHKTDPAETVNVAELKENMAIVTKLSEQLAGAKNVAPKPVEGKKVLLLEKGKANGKQAKDWDQRDGYLEAKGIGNRSLMNLALGQGDFHIKMRLRMQDQKNSAASFYLDGNHFGFEGRRGTIYLNGPIFGGLKILQPTTDVFDRGAWIDFEVTRNNTTLFYQINGKAIYVAKDAGQEFKQVGLNPFRSTMQLSDVTVQGNLKEAPKPIPYTDVFVQGKDKYPRIRIPAIVTTKQGTLLAFAEGRQGGDHSKNDIILKRSTDGGKTWGPLQVVHEAGDLCLNNPQPVVLPETGRVLLIYQRNKYGERQVVPGFDGEGSAYTLLQYSDDDGKTWSKPRDITRGVKRPAPITSQASGPGVGIVLRRGPHKGRIIMPFNQGPFGKWKVYAAYSDDNGKTWKYGDTAPDGEKGLGNEVQMVELADGSVMLNSRSSGGNRCRKTAISRDGGLTWSTLQDDPTLIEPQCQGSILRYSDPADGKPGILLFANPASQSSRKNGTLRISKDDGKTWPTSKLIYPGGYAYSCLTVLKDGSVGVLFERDGYQRISFSRLTLPVTEEDGAKKSTTKDARPNVLLIVSEDNGPELGCYGDPYVKTPHLDALASRGVRFENAFVTYSVCSPSRASIFTGKYPHQNGQIGLATHKFAMYEKWPNMVSLLKAGGYRTGIIGKIHVNSEAAFPCDFRAFPGSNFNNRPVKEFAEEAGEFMGKNSEPFFLMVNYPDAHFPLLRQQYGLPEKPLSADDVKPLPWVAADSPRLREFTANYYNCLMRLDTGVGMLLDELKKTAKADNTLVIYLGDHGAQFSRGKTSVYEAGLRIPLIIYQPNNAKAGLVRKELVSTLDLLPTVLDATGVTGPKDLPGRSLLPLLRGENPKWREHIVGVTTGAAPALYYPQFSIRDKRYKMILSPLRDRENTCANCYLTRYNAHFAAGTSQEEIDSSGKLTKTVYQTYIKPPSIELYDLQTDPNEFHNLAEDPAHANVRKDLEQSLATWRTQTRDPISNPTLLERLTNDHDLAPKLNYRKDRSFRWHYLDYFPAAMKRKK